MLNTEVTVPDTISDDVTIVLSNDVTEEFNEIMARPISPDS